MKITLVGFLLFNKFAKISEKFKKILSIFIINHSSHKFNHLKVEF